jgi:hypothetical protein
MSIEPLIDFVHILCGQAAFRTTTRPVKDTRIDLSIIRRLDGSTPSPSEPMKCGTCGEPIHYADIEPEGGYAE